MRTKLNLNTFLNRAGCKLAVLIDPDKFNPELIEIAKRCEVSCFLVGGSGPLKQSVHSVVKYIRERSKVPVILFPGNEHQLSPLADGLLLLSLLSGRNPEYLISKHVKAAPKIKKMALQYLSTAYLLIGEGRASTTQKVTGTQPLTKIRDIVNTALAAEQLGFKAVYLEAGSGAGKCISPALIARVKRETVLPLIVGGGIDSVAKARKIAISGVSLMVIGNALEKKPELLLDISSIFSKP